MAEATESTFYVYQHTFADGSIYIGKGTGNRAYRMTHSKRSEYWLRAARKYGNPGVSFIKTGADEELALLVEAEAIEAFEEQGYKLRNLAAGGYAPQAGMTGELSCNFGSRHSEDWRIMMSFANSRDGNPHYGMSHSGRAKEAISQNTKKTWQSKYEEMRAINKGRRLTEEHKAKIGAASSAMPAESREAIRRKNTGKKRTPEQLENYRRAGERRRGKKMPEEAKRKMSEKQWQKDREVHSFVGPDGQRFRGTRSDFRKEFGFSVNDLFRADSKRRPHVKGWRLELEKQ